jgi:DNA-binding NarL/FixJ family response regulator
MHTLSPALVGIAHQDPVIEAGLRHILSKWTEFQVDMPADQPRPPDAAAVPDVLVLDHAAGIAWATQHRDRLDRTRVLIVSQGGQIADVRAALQVGVRGYVVTGCSEAEIVNATRAVAAGRRHLCTTATLRMADSLSQPTLTEREYEVLALVCRGRNNKDVARALDICVGTVKSHMRGILSKLDAKCRTEALCIATERGLIRSAGPAAPQLVAM